jgi:hypothetical protein
MDKIFMFEEFQKARQEVNQVDLKQAIPTSKTIAQQVIPLLEERLIVNFKKQKTAEVVVRKEIETRTINVPVRREKLIVEQLTPTYKQLAEVDLGNFSFEEITFEEKADVNGEPESIVENREKSSFSSSEPIIKGEFSCIEAARNFLDTISTVSDDGCEIVRIEVILKDLSHK